MYIGQTGRSFTRRLYDHQNSFDTADKKSIYAKHLVEEKHEFNEHFTILHQSEKGSSLNYLESLEINKLRFKNYLLNDQLEINNSPLLNLFHV